MLASLYHRKKDFVKAAEWAERALQINPRGRAMADILWHIPAEWVKKGMALRPIVFVNHFLVPSIVQENEKI